MHSRLVRRPALAAALVATALLAGSAGAVPPLPSGPVVPAPDATSDCAGLDALKAPWVRGLTPAQDTEVDVKEHWLERPDGTRLELTIYLPRAFPGPRPTVLYATPYSSQFTQVVGVEELHGTPLYDGTVPPGAPYPVPGSRNGFASCETGTFLRRGYAWVTYDLRGTGDSTGCYDNAGRREQEDGKAVIDWIAAQPWSDRKVGMTGFSLEGLAQLAVAATRPPALKAIIPVSASDVYVNFREGGTRPEPFLVFTNSTGLPPGVRAGSACDPETVKHVDLAEHAVRDDFWRERDPATLASRISVPTLMAVGSPADTTFSFWPVWSALEASRTPRKGLVGPWGHTKPTVAGWPLHELRWFEHHLRGVDTGVMREPRLTLLETGARPLQVARLPKTETVFGLSRGTLTRQPAPGQASWTDSPGQTRPMLEADPAAHLSYTTAAARRDTVLSGTPRVELSASINADDANLLAVLYAVGPDGRKRFLGRGALDAVLRDGLDKPARAVPVGVAQSYQVPLWPGHTVLQKGHRIQLVLTAGESCTVDPDNCTYPGVEDYTGRPVAPNTTRATITVHEGPKLSRLILPLAGL